MSIELVVLDWIKTGLLWALMLSILVVVHEWGHFIVARLFGIRVDEFSIGFGPRALRIGKLGDTEYNLRWLPMGGYVKIAGMEADEQPLLDAKDKLGEVATKAYNKFSVNDLPLIAENTPEVDENAAQYERDAIDGFYSKPIWQRSLVIFAGPFMSFILGYFLIFGIALTIGVPDRALNVIEQVMPGSQAEKIGLKAGDQIIKINNKPITDGDQMIDIIHTNVNQKITLVVVTGGITRTIIGIPQPTLSDGQKIGILGFQPKFDIKRTTFFESIQGANNFTHLWITTIGSLFARHNFHELRGNLGGPIYIISATKQAVDSGGPSYPFLIAQLSMSLALFNLLPIPILDGGHLFIFLIEALRNGKRLSLEAQQRFMLAGLAVIGVLFVLIMFNDIVRAFHL